LDAAYDVGDRQRAVQQYAYGYFDLSACCVVESCTLEPDAVHGARRRPMSLRNGVRGNIFICERARYQKRIGSQPYELRDPNETAQKYVLLGDNVPRELSCVRDDDVIGELTVVAEMSVRHDQIVVAYARNAPAFLGPEVYADVFADSIVVADFE
jgi:hypothetical protein